MPHGTATPLILLDEVDKLGNDYKGDPSSALLEVLDAEQNSAFRDHYIELPFDLSRVLFITTANVAQNIPAPLYDRMEIIELGSYTAQEKFHIAKEHLIPKQSKLHGLSGRTLRFTDDAVRMIIDGYTREAGVRRLEQQIASVCRKAAKQIIDGVKRVTVKPENLEELLGARKYKNEPLRDKGEIGVVNGLAWTSVGGELLEVEAAVLDGTGKLELTGSLGDVMKESAKAKKLRIKNALAALQAAYPDARPQLDFTNPFELLVATMLSAQCTDKRVNMVTAKLFPALGTPQKLADATEEEVISYIRGCGLFNTKAKNLIAAAKIIHEQYNDEVPEDRDVLMGLPGVGRKTANVVVSNAFGVPAIAVDTHVFRVSNRIGLAEAKDVGETERQLMENIPKEDWSKAHHWIIYHGRQICSARKPNCGACTVRDYCRAYLDNDIK